MAVPKIRFPGFTEDWEQRKLGDLADIVGGGTPSTSKSEYWNGDIDWYAPAEIADQIYVSSSQKKITQAGYDNSSAKMLPVGTVLFTSRAGIGKTAILAQKGCTNQGFQSIVPHEGQLDSYFIFSRTDELKKYGETTGAGSTFVEVSGKQMARMELLMPPTLSEQQEIGRFFASLDSTITLHQRKLESMKLLKKSLLQKMFPKSGETVPEVRSPGFTDAWEQRKLDKIANRYDNLRIPVTASDRISGTTPYYGANGIQDYVKGFTHDGEFVLIAEDGANDLHNYPVQYVNGKVWVNNHAHVLQGINGLVDTRFLGYAFSQVNMEAILVGGSRAKLNASDLMKIEIRLPRLMQEQQHIATFLHSLDQTITLHQRKVEALQKLKKSLLQQMFV